MLEQIVTLAVRQTRVTEDVNYASWRVRAFRCPGLRSHLVTTFGPVVVTGTFGCQLRESRPFSTCLFSCPPRVVFFAYERWRTVSRRWLNKLLWERLNKLLRENLTDRTVVLIGKGTDEPKAPTWSRLI